MEKHSQLLQNTTARVIYYSCLSDYKTIPEVAKLWGYRSAAYFYHSNSRELLNRMVTAQLVVPRGIGKGREEFYANYNMILDEPDLTNFLKKVNEKTEIELIQEEYPEIAYGQLSDPLFREYCLNRKRELKERTAKILFDQQAIECLAKLWEHPLYKRVFTTGESLSKAFHRTRLPADPRELVFGITVSLCEKLFELERGLFTTPPFVYLFVDFDIEDMLPTILNQLDLAANPSNKDERNEFNSFIQEFKKAYEALRKRMSIYEQVEDVGSYHIRRFASLVRLGNHTERE